MIGNTDTVGREIVLKQEPAFAVKKPAGKYSGKYDLEKSHKEAFETAKKCKFCGFNWPHANGQISCPAWGKECHECFQKNHFACCCLNEAENKSKMVQATWRACESSEPDSDEKIIGRVYESESELHEKVIVKVKGQPINFIVDTGSSSMIVTKQAYLELIKNNNEICLTETKVKLTPYGSNESLKLLGKFKTLIEYEET